MVHKIRTSLIISFLSIAFVCNYACAHPDKSHKHEPELSEEEKALLADDGKVSISINQKTWRVEFADSAEERQLGLMFRPSMCPDCGMLFDFGETKPVSIWMKNTKIPLDLAYVNEQGEILEIVPLVPFDLSPVPASQPVRYALEMNRGWFAAQGIKPGMQITINTDKPTK